MPITEKFLADTRLNAFILGSLATTGAVVAGVVIKLRMDTFTDKDGNKVTHHTSWKSIIYTIIITFVASLLAYAILYYLFDMGGGMMSCD